MKFLLSLLFAAFACHGFAQSMVVIPSVQQRAATIETISGWVNKTDRSAELAKLNPFSMRGFETAVSSAAAATPAASNEPVSDHDLLSTLAEKIETRGRFVMNGEAMLLIGGKKLRVGSKVPVAHDGLVYELEISGIETTKFTVRYKTEEYTRAISKSQTKKP